MAASVGSRNSSSSAQTRYSLSAAESGSGVQGAGSSQPVANPSTALDSYQGAAPDLLSTVDSSLQNSFLYREYGFNPPTLKLGKNGALWTQLSVKLLKPDDAVIKGDPQREATMKAAQRAGKKITWAEVRGALDPGVWVPAWVPAGPVNVTAGFSADAKLGFSTLAPYSNNLKTAVKSLSFKPPVTPAQVRHLPVGTEIAVEGRGRVAISTGIHGGDSFLPVNGPLTVGVSYGVDSYLSKESRLELRIKRMDKDRVRVTITHTATTGKGEVTSLRAGVHSNLGKALPQTGGIVGVGERFAVNKISGQIEHWLSLDVSQIYSKSNSNQKIASYVLDLSKPDAARAYQALLMLDTRPAEALVRRGATSGVRTAREVSTTRSVTSGVQAHFGPITLLSSMATSTLQHEQIETPEGPAVLDSGKVDANHDDILTRWWSGRKQATSQIVSWDQPGQSQELGLWHVRSDIKVDGWTSAGNVRKFLLTATALGVHNAATTKALGNAKFQDSFGASEMVLDASLTDAGFSKVLGASSLQVRQAFSQAYETLDRPYDVPTLPWETNHAWRVSPWLETDAPKYGEVMRLLAKGPDTAGPPGHGNQQSDRNQQYYWLTGRDLGDDAAAYRESLKFEALIAKLRQAATPQDRAAILASARNELPSDDRKEMYALGILAGQGGVHVDEASIRDRNHGKTLTFVQQGTFQDPQAILAGWINDPEHGPPPAQ